MMWESREFPREAIGSLSDKLKVSPTLATLLLRIGICDPDDAFRFIHPNLNDLEDPFCLTNIDRAVQRLHKAIKGGESIVVQGDYDVDGITSTVLFVSMLRKLKLSVRYFVARRKEEGYGLSRASIDRSLEAGIPDIFVALDCGTNSTEEVAYLNSLGVDVIIFDHHRCSKEIPEDCILVNPYISDQKSAPWGQLCSVGLVFKWMHALVQHLRRESDPLASKISLRDSLDLVALGTIADLVPLKGENRILTRFGLRELEKRSRRGIHALCEVSKINPGQTIFSADVSYRLGPRINASGRLANAELPIDMLLEDDSSLCKQAAEQLNSLNRQRQEIERGIVKEATQKANEQLPDAMGLVVYGVDWHPGVVGIVAGKLCRDHNRPSVVLSIEGEEAKGSGRSIPEVNLLEVLKTFSHLLEHWGGHPRAMGITLKTENLEAFVEAFNLGVSKILKNEVPSATLEIADWISSDALSEAFLRELDCMHPYGEANPEPIFGIRNTQFLGRLIGFGSGGIHFRFQIPGTRGRLVNGVAWNKGKHLPPVNTPLDLACKLNWNQWNGRKYMQVELIDWRLPE